MNIVNAISTFFGMKGPDAVTSGHQHGAAEHTELPASTAEQNPAQILATALSNEGFSAVQIGNEVSLPSGIKLTTEFIESSEINAERVRTVTSVTATHEVFFPEGLVEYQHSGGSTVEQSIAAGFSSWAKMDLVTLEDSVRSEPQDCLLMTMQFPEKEGSEEFVRQIMMGPISHLVAEVHKADDPEHSFCPCCLFTQSSTAFGDLLQSKNFYGIRLFVARNTDGTHAADCRVNGVDFPLGVEQLLDYARTWPGNGLEFRKQYVVVRTAPAIPWTHGDLPRSAVA